VSQGRAGFFIISTDARRAHLFPVSRTHHHRRKHTTSDHISCARSADFALPPAIATRVDAGAELGDADDQVFGRTDSGSGSGTIGVLMAGVVTRATYYEHATLMALVPFLAHAPLYGDDKGQM
jgi:hypothetical protein